MSAEEGEADTRCDYAGIVIHQVGAIIAAELQHSKGIQLSAE